MPPVSVAEARDFAWSFWVDRRPFGLRQRWQLRPYHFQDRSLKHAKYRHNVQSVGSNNLRSGYVMTDIPNQPHRKRSLDWVGVPEKPTVQRALCHVGSAFALLQAHLGGAYILKLLYVYRRDSNIDVCTVYTSMSLRMESLFCITIYYCTVYLYMQYIYTHTVKHTHTHVPTYSQYSLCCLHYIFYIIIFIPQQQNAMGSLHNIYIYRFRCVLGEVGRFREGGSGKEPGSGNRFQVSMGSAGGASRFRWFPTGSGVRKVVPRFEWVLTGSGFPRFANWFRELVPGFDRFRGSESGNALRRGIFKPPCCWGYRLRLFYDSILSYHMVLCMLPILGLDS